jgi:competence ComEA-like helix-hairpin-helix protein
MDETESPASKQGLAIKLRNPDRKGGNSTNAHRKPRFALLRVISVIVLSLFACSCVRLPRKQTETISTFPQSTARDQTATPNRININTAPVGELEQLPGVGKVLAERIVTHREQYGPFRRAEHLMMVRGFSDSKFRKLRDLVTVE